MMGFFGIFQPTTGASQIRITSIHMNVWSFHRSRNPIGIYDLIPALGQHKMYVDVGMHIEVDRGNLRHLHMVLPGGVKSESLVDLSNFVLDPNVNDFIFGGPVRVEGDQIHYDQDGGHGDTVVPSSELGESGKGISLLVLDRYLTPAGDRPGKYYIRFRYSCARPHEIIRHKPWGFNKRGIIFDLRVNDVRAAPPQTSHQRLLEIEKIYLFAILPVSYVPVLSNPPLHYSRLLERQHWSSYLNSCKAGDKKGLFTTYYWKINHSTNTNKPLRAFMHLQNEFGNWFLALYVIGVSVPIISALFRHVFGWG